MSIFPPPFFLVSGIHTIWVVQLNSTFKEVYNTVVKTIRRTNYNFLYDLLFIVVQLYCNNNNTQVFKRFPP